MISDTLLMRIWALHKQPL